jgi:hypothetical protein
VLSGGGGTQSDRTGACPSEKISRPSFLCFLQQVNDIADRNDDSETRIHPFFLTGI